MISDADLDSLRALVGTRLAVPARPHVEYATVDTIRNFARSTGDDNPLYCDPDVAARSVHGGLIAPPLFPLATGTDAPGAPTSEPEALRVLRGAHVEVRGDRWDFGAPVRPGARLIRTDTITEVHRRPPRHPHQLPHVVITTESRYTNGSTWHATNTRTRIYRRNWPPEPHEAPRAKAHYTDDQIGTIEEAIAAWTRRGATTRTFGSVNDHAMFGPMVKGPLTITDLVAYRGGVGAGPYDVEPLELAIANRAKRPGFYDRTDTNAWDARERLHWDEAYAQRHGHASAYDYSHTRLVWATQLVTDWMGDAGRLEWITFRRLTNNYVGDTQWLTAKIGELEPGERNGRVRIGISIDNQTDRPTAWATASVLLPMR